jgi:thiamine transport system ATP-binding protein
VRLALDGAGVTLAGARILEDVSVDVASGERLAVLGPSGSGKSTLLRVVAGLQPPTTGRVLLDGRDVTGVPPYRRGVGLVFQDAALFPHRDVAGNVGFGPKVAGLDEHARRSRVTEALELVGLAGAENRVVTTLSGGEAQRVALARALAPRPQILLLDEPLGSLDGPLRLRLQDDLRDLFERLSLTVVHVTHDVGEAFALGDRVAILRDGQLAQVATPEALWARPADDWVARFLGLRNIARDGDHATVTRPEAVRVEQGQGAVVVAVDRDGPLVRLRVRQDDGAELESVTTGTEHPGPGDRVSVTVDSAGVFEVPVWQGSAHG